MQGDLSERLTIESSNVNVRSLLNAIPKEGRPGDFWNTLLSEPTVSAFPGVKIAELKDFPYFPDRKIILSVGFQSTNEIDENMTEADIRDKCLKSARDALLNFSGGATWFEVKKQKSITQISKLDANQSEINAEFSDIAERLGMLRVGRTNTGAYACIIGGIMKIIFMIKAISRL